MEIFRYLVSLCDFETLIKIIVNFFIGNFNNILTDSLKFSIDELTKENIVAL